jgi:hypothetical protein
LYDQLPLWSLIIGVSTIIASGSSAVWLLYLGNKDTASFALLPVLIQSILLIGLPWSLGYIVLFGDAMIHIGNIRDILLMNQLPEQGFSAGIYPSLHLMNVSLVEVTDLGATSVYSIFNVISIIIFLVLTCLLANRFGLHPAYVIIVSPLAFLGITTSNPSAYAYKTSLPLLVYIWSAIDTPKSSSRWLIIFFLTTVSAWLQHPFVGAFFGFVLLITISTKFGVIQEAFINRFQTVQLSPSDFLDRYVFYASIGAFWFTYGSSFLLKKSTEIALQLILDIQYKKQYRPGGGVQETIIEGLGFDYIDLAVLAIKRFGGWFLLFLLGIFGGCICIARLFNPREDRQLIHILVPLSIGIAGLWSVGELAIGIVPSVNFIRILRPAAVLAPLLAGVTLWFLLDERREWGKGQVQSVLIPLVVVMLLISGLTVSTASAYESPWVIGGNSYISPAEAQGTEWFFEKKAANRETLTLGRGLGKYREFILGPSAEIQRASEFSGERNVPPNYGYGEVKKFGNFIENDSYYFENRHDRVMSSSIGSTPFSRKNYSRLQFDHTVNRIYTNRNVNISTVARVSD